MTKTISITLDKERRLKFDINALADAEMQLGMGIGKIMLLEANFAVLRVLLWAGTKWADRRMTIERAGHLLQEYVNDGGDLDDLGVKILEALMTCGLFSEVDEDEDPNEKTEASI